MTTKLKTELFIEDDLGNESIVYPFVESDHISFDNGMTIKNMIAQDVSTPVVVHDTTSFKVGVGDSDISNSVVDSSVGSMTIKGQTYQNIIPDPSLRNKTNGNEMQKFNEGYDDVNVVDGLVKSAILSGQTLVNCSSIIENSIGGVWATVRLSNLTVQGGKKYLIVLQHLPENYQWALTNVGVNETVQVGYNKSKYAIFTATANISETILVHVNDGGKNALSKTELEKVSPIIVEYQDGMENLDIPYFTGMTSCKMPVLSSIGKNLFSTRIEKGIIDGSTGNIGEHTNYGRTIDYIGVNPNMVLNISSNGILPYAVFYYDVNKKYIGVEKIPTLKFTTPNNCYFVKLTWMATNIDISLITNVQLEQGTATSTYEPHKSNILSTPSEVVLRNLPNGVCDTLNVKTGEYIQRIGEYTFDGSHPVYGSIDITGDKYCYSCMDVITDNKRNLASNNQVCDIFPIKNPYNYATEDCAWLFYNQTSSYFRIGLKDYCDENRESDVILWLKENPVTVQYELETPVVKTVVLSSIGNWEKVVLDGSDDETYNIFSSQANASTGTQLYQIPVSDSETISNNAINIFSNKSNLVPCTANDLWHDRVGGEGISFGNANSKGIIQLRVKIKTVAELKQYLQANPITVWYQTSTQKSNSIKEILSFSNGHIQLSSGVENSLIPSIDYEVPTSNSYHMDLLKTNTVYTMKSDSASGTCSLGKYSVIDLLTNKTFSISQGYEGDKLLVVNGSWTNPMILEGDVTSKTIPYFKGIKSAFENEDKIEVLSCGKNLFDGKFAKGYLSDATGEPGTGNLGLYSINYIKCVSGTVYRISGNETTVPRMYFYGKDKEYIKYDSGSDYNRVFVAPANAKYMRFRLYAVTELDVDLFGNSIQVEVSQVRTTYESYKSNSVKIPLLSPLRSLPNGIRDEIVLDRENNKAKIIQRVGKVVLSGATHETWVKNTPLSDENFTVMHNTGYTTLKEDTIFTNLRCDKILVENYLEKSVECVSRYLNGKEFVIKIPTSKLSQPDSTGIRKWLIRNPITIYYELATPIVTEVDIEGYPYIFKDGHIFLNGEITPKTEIKYSINQSHVIESQNSDLIRHEKETDYLYKLIGEYVRVSYDSTLLTLNLELK